MTIRSSDRAREKALDVLTREAADLATPELDWDRIEKSVLAAYASASEPEKMSAAATHVSGVRVVQRPPTWSSSPWPMALAAAAAAALIYGSTSGVNHAPEQAENGALEVSTSRAPVAKLASLDVGEVAETDVQAALYDKPGVVRFSLAPNSRLEVVANNMQGERTGGITVALARGSIHADVTPRSEGEVFAVEVERTRIAVHGTSFTVTREGDKVVVDVAHGSVAVGPVGHRGSTHGWLVVGPDRAVFSLDGAREAAWVGAPPESAIATVEPSAPPAVVSEAPASRAKRPAVAAVPSRPDALAASSKVENTAHSATPSVTAWGEGSTTEGSAASDQEAAEIASIVRKLETCYEKQVSAFGVRFTVESSLELSLLPSGAIREGVFTPPLSPTLMSCANTAVGAAHFPKGEAARQIRIPVQLSRAPR